MATFFRFSIFCFYWKKNDPVKYLPKDTESAKKPVETQDTGKKKVAIWLQKRKKQPIHVF